MKILAKDITMLALFYRDGKIEPVRFKIADDNGEEQVIKIDKITSISETKIAGKSAIVFSCQSEIGKIMKIYELKYRMDEHKWELYKM